MFHPIAMVFGLALWGALVGCRGQPQLSADGDLASQTRVGTVAYFMAAPIQDPGVIYVHAVNSNSTACVGAGDQPMCGVARIDFTHSGLNADTTGAFEPVFLAGDGVIEGWMERVLDLDTGDYETRLFAVDAWRDHTDNAQDSTIHRVTTIDIQCVTAPCPTYEGTVVNTAASALLHAVDLDASGAAAADIDYAHSLLVRGAAILVGGEVEVYTGDTEARDIEVLPGTKTLVSETFYTRVTDGSL